jgi:hypothetical protein
MIRARFGRKAALTAAKREAYAEAKDSAIRYVFIQVYMFL